MWLTWWVGELNDMKQGFQMIWLSYWVIPLLAVSLSHNLVWSLISHIRSVKRLTWILANQKAARGAARRIISKSCCLDWNKVFSPSPPSLSLSLSVCLLLLLYHSLTPRSPPLLAALIRRQKINNPSSICHRSLRGKGLMAWLKVITLLEFSLLMGKIDPLPSVCTQTEFVCGGGGESRSTGGEKRRNIQLKGNTKMNKGKALFCDAASVSLAVPSLAPALVTHLDELSALK